MTTKPNSKTGREDRRREYLRLPKRYRVDFSVMSVPENLLDMGRKTGSTRNVSMGGLCLETDVIGQSIFRYMENQEVLLDLRIHVPKNPEPLRAVAEVAWFEEPRKGCYIIGLEFRSIAISNIRQLLGETTSS